MVLDAVSLGSDESVSSQSSTSGSPTEKTQNALGGSEASGAQGAADAVGPSTALWWNPASFCTDDLTSAASAVTASDTNMRDESIPSRKAKAVYPCEAEHDSELSFQVGAIFDDVIVSREPGWLEGVLEGKRGLIPENYVEML
ncbi:rho GTPase-activating protein 10-like [Brienomyrus brachyistius]|uniref:rho GTPase-activating protein 10-like n=1 Tax=Brienomyrus brachyistius TaxID=42636 RepID=UPI0020B267A4|nr:rho GTPase-activating protein 10-like [Brienomyrus brachyistius]